MSFVYQLLASLFLALRSVLPIQIDNLPKPIREIVVTPTPTATPTPLPTPTPTPTPKPVLGYATAHVGEGSPGWCPGNVNVYTVPPCEGGYGNYSTYIRDLKGNVV